jgi:glycosyltransferase involved in cell wall biosynthesis
VSSRVIIAHDFAEMYGGAERILGTIAAVFPEAEVWAIAGRRSVAERIGVADRFHTLLPESDRFLRHYRGLAPLYPTLVRRRSLPAADLLLTSSYAFAHGFRTANDAPHMSYCYSPLRFAWSMTQEYAGKQPFTGRAFRLVAASARRADRRAAGRVTTYVAESHHVAGQILSAYRRNAHVIHPPVDCSVFRPAREPGHDGYYLFCGRLIEPYKRLRVVLETFRALPHLRLVVAGDGPAREGLRAQASPNVEFVGHLEDDELVPLMQRCAAAVFPSEDDFGLVPLEVMACGRPVLAFGGGGALETVAPGKTGEFFREPTAHGLRAALEQFDPDAYDPVAIRAHALKWDRPVFEGALREAVAATAALRQPPEVSSQKETPCVSTPASSGLLHSAPSSSASSRR